MAEQEIEGSPTCDRDGCENKVSIDYAVGKPDRYLTICSDCSGPNHGMYAAPKVNLAAKKKT